jgi:hypothetical protein
MAAIAGATREPVKIDTSLAWRSAPRDAERRPFPRDETTPPVTNMNRAMGFGA